MGCLTMILEDGLPCEKLVLQKKEDGGVLSVVFYYDRCRCLRSVSRGVRSFICYCVGAA